MTYAIGSWEEGNHCWVSRKRWDTGGDCGWDGEAWHTLTYIARGEGHGLFLCNLQSRGVGHGEDGMFYTHVHLGCQAWNF